MHFCLLLVSAIIHNVFHHRYCSSSVTSFILYFTYLLLSSKTCSNISCLTSSKHGFSRSLFRTSSSDTDCIRTYSLGLSVPPLRRFCRLRSTIYDLNIRCEHLSLLTFCHVLFLKGKLFDCMLVDND